MTTVILYKVLINQKERIVIDYRNQKPVTWDSGVKALVRTIEDEIAKSPLRGYRDAARVGLSVAAMNASVVYIGKERVNLFKWDIMTDPYDIEVVKFFGSEKFMVAACDGKNAMKYWDKGLKPQLPEGKPDDSNN